ncbi:peptidoglycan DD-metalloendopeptidase family protein [Devosia sp. 1566]|uniref:murein hydrolase activator EnvC family protein n=1 Tax=Devosia sp. 1566 TaxID=2499144 RepID=UPI000FD96167|nr:peptidoglycan DD-metalloendopeptidase family protein [Devosia sp. 1566]
MSVSSGARWGVVLAVVAAALAPAPSLLAQGPAPQGELAPALPTDAPPAASTDISPGAAPPVPPAAPDAALPAAPTTPELGVDPAAVPPPPAELPPDPVTTQAELAKLEASITMSKERADELRAEIAAMQGDRTQQNAALIAAAQRVKLAEIEVADIEERLSGLIVQELEVRGRLDGADAEMANVLAALERISLNPPPALIVDPADALGSARSAILIAAIVPQLRAKADAVTADLQELTKIKEAALAEEAALRANYSVLEEEQLRIATLIAARSQGIAAVSADLEATEQEAMALAARATTLRELIDQLSARIEEGPTPPQVEGEDAVLTPEAVQTALANTARTEPAVPFASAKGFLTLPANGVKVVDYGAGDGFGGISQGVSLMTRAEAQVVAPADGWVLYTGPYLNYGQIVILNSGQGYTILLAGLETVTVSIGQFVLMGEPVGTMGSRTIGRTVTTSAGNAQPTLYIELRHNSEPLDPTGWWANPTQSG